MPLPQPVKPSTPGTGDGGPTSAPPPAQKVTPTTEDASAAKKVSDMTWSDLSSVLTNQITSAINNTVSPLITNQIIVTGKNCQ